MVIVRHYGKTSMLEKSSFQLENFDIFWNAFLAPYNTSLTVCKWFALRFSLQGRVYMKQDLYTLYSFFLPHGVHRVIQIDSKM